MVDHICEPIPSTPFASSELRRPPQDGGKTPLTVHREDAHKLLRALASGDDLHFALMNPAPPEEEPFLSDPLQCLAKTSFDRVEPVVEKLPCRLDFGLRQARRRGMACHGVISAGAQTPESLVELN
jgi:hypothetical protein